MWKQLGADVWKKLPGVFLIDPILLTITWSLGKAKQSGYHWSISSCRSRSDHSQIEMVPSSAVQSCLISGGMSALILLEVCWRVGKEDDRFNIRTWGIKTSQSSLVHTVMFCSVLTELPRPQAHSSSRLILTLILLFLPMRHPCPHVHPPSDLILSRSRSLPLPPQSPAAPTVSIP